MKKAKKGKPVAVYPTAVERKQIEKAAMEVGLKLTDYFRMLHRKYWERRTMGVSDD